MDAHGVSTGADRPSAAEPEGDVRTFLIADVRGYTPFTQAFGDEEAGKLAARFAELAREVVVGTAGEVVELRGDEALCVFRSARQALRAAVELQARFRERVNGQPAFPLGIGIGLDAGEAVPVEDGYRGGALNLASRLCSLAKPGQILASDTVTSLARAIEGVRFVDRRRAVRVKGIEKRVRVIEVVPEIELPPVPDALAGRARRRRGPPPDGGRDRPSRRRDRGWHPPEPRRAAPRRSRRAVASAGSTRPRASSSTPSRSGRLLRPWPSRKAPPG